MNINVRQQGAFEGGDKGNKIRGIRQILFHLQQNSPKGFLEINFLSDSLSIGFSLLSQILFLLDSLSILVVSLSIGFSLSQIHFLL